VNSQSADDQVERVIGVGQRLAEDGLIDLGLVRDPRAG